MKILFYKKGRQSPIEKYIDRLTLKDQARFLEVIDEIETHGLNAVRIIFKTLEGKL